jgi:hypothetical protein
VEQPEENEHPTTPADLRQERWGHRGEMQRGWQVLSHGDGNMRSLTIGTGRRDEVLRPRELP